MLNIDLDILYGKYATRSENPNLKCLDVTEFKQAIAEYESNRLEKLVMPTLTGNLEEDLQIIYQNGKPYGIRDRSGYLLFFTKITHYTGQEKRYQEEIDQQNKLAEYLLHQLSKCWENDK